MKKVSTTSTHEQVWEGHKDLFNESIGAYMLTDETLCLLRADNVYQYKDFRIEVTEKVTNYGSGGHTVWSGNINGEGFINWTIEDIKTYVGCTYVRAKASTKTPLCRLVVGIEKLKSDILEVNNEDFREKALSLLEYAKKLRNEEAEAEAKAKAEAEAEAKAKAKAERANKQVENATDEAMYAEIAKRKGMTIEQVKALFA